MEDNLKILKVKNLRSFLKFKHTFRGPNQSWKLLESILNLDLGDQPKVEDNPQWKTSFRDKRGISQKLPINWILLKF